MQIKTVTDIIESFASLALQESYDNAGLLIGSPNWQVSGALVCVDVTEAVIEEAIEQNVNLIIAHHPLIFKGLKRITGKNEQERCVMKAIKQDIAIYAAHTNADNVVQGVNGMIADRIGLENRQVLQPKPGIFVKIVTFVPEQHARAVREAMFEAGAGHIGNYDACSFNVEGYGSFRANANANPFVGEKHKIHHEAEIRIETVLPDYIKNKVIQAMLEVHPYEAPAYDVFPLLNEYQHVGSGLTGELKNAVSETEFIRKMKAIFGNHPIRHTALTGKKIKKIAVCGGSGSFLIQNAIKAGADIFISGDFKYHDFFLAENKLILADVGHFETEQFTKELFFDIIRKKLPTFAVHISKVNTNPIIYS